MSSTPDDAGGARRKGLHWLGGTGPIYLIFTVSAALLFGVLYGLTTRYLDELVDARLSRKCTQLVARSAEDVREAVSKHGLAEGGAERPYGLFSANGMRLAGNISLAPEGRPDATPFSYTQNAVEKGGRFSTRTYRAMAVTMADGNRVVVGQAVDDSDRFDRMLIRVAAVGLIGTIVLGTMCGFALHRASNVRIRLLREACQAIAESHCGRRLPARGNGDDIDLLVGFVNAMLDDIERLVLELRGVCAWIAHDLRKPMTALRTGLERARRSAASVGEYEHAVDGALAQTVIVLDRFSALLRIAEIDAQARKDHFSPIDLTMIAQDVVELYEPVADEKAIQLVLTSNVRADVLGDQDLLFGAIQNLVDNALKFTPSGGSVRLRVLSSSARTTLEVADTGPGIAREERDTVLRPFYRGSHMSSMPSPGHGLGLSIVAATARLHNAGLCISDCAPGCRVELSFTSLDIGT